MGRNKKIKDIEQQNDVELTGLIYDNNENINEEVIVKELTIHEKYDKYIQMVRGNYIRGIEYNEIMEIVQYVQVKTSRNYPLNISCAACVLQLIQLFDILR